MPKNHKPKKPIKDLKLDISDEMIAERRGGSGKMPQDMPKWMASMPCWPLDISSSD